MNEIRTTSTGTTPAIGAPHAAGEHGTDDPDRWRLLASIEAYQAANTAAARRLHSEPRHLAA